MVRKRSTLHLTNVDFTEQAQLIYRLPGRDVLFHKREYFVTEVQRKAVENVSQQDERSCGRADACVEKRKRRGKIYMYKTFVNHGV